MGLLGEFFEERFADPGPREFVAASGRRRFSVTERVTIEEVQNSVFHQERMAEMASRAVRWLAEQPVQIEWHTLQFSVFATEQDEKGNEIAQQWRWEVWVS